MKMIISKYFTTKSIMKKKIDHEFSVEHGCIVYNKILYEPVNRNTYLSATGCLPAIYHIDYTNAIS